MLTLARYAQRTPHLLHRAPHGVPPRSLAVKISNIGKRLFSVDPVTGYAMAKFGGCLATHNASLICALSHASCDGINSRALTALGVFGMLGSAAYAHKLRKEHKERELKKEAAAPTIWDPVTKTTRRLSSTGRAY